MWSYHSSTKSFYNFVNGKNTDFFNKMQNRQIIQKYNTAWMIQGKICVAREGV